MTNELYIQLFNRLKELGAIRETEHYIGSDYPPILSDCLNAIHLVGGNGAVGTTGKIIANLARTNRANGSYTEMQWDLSLPLLSQQSQEVGEKLLELLTD